MNRITRIKVTEMNHHLQCILCGGYLVDATTIIECLHSFCRTCILKYLESSKFCPICDVQVHKTRPYLNIRSDKTLQALVYKLVPGLFQSEMKRRRDFYADQPDTASTSSNDGEDRGEVPDLTPLFTEDQNISLCLQHFEKLPPYRQKKRIKGQPPDTGSDTRYLLCPAAVTIRVLKKFVRMKFDLGQNFKIELFHSNEPLEDEYTLMDIAHIYCWRMRDPLKLFYFVYDKKDLPDDSFPFLPAVHPVPHLSLPSPSAYPASQSSPSPNSTLEGKPEPRLKKKPGRKPGRKKKLPDDKYPSEIMSKDADKEKVPAGEHKEEKEMKKTQEETVKEINTKKAEKEESASSEKDTAEKDTEKKDSISTENVHPITVNKNIQQESIKKSVQQDSSKKNIQQNFVKKTVQQDSVKKVIQPTETPQQDGTKKAVQQDSGKKTLQDPAKKIQKNSVKEHDSTKKNIQQDCVTKPVQSDSGKDVTVQKDTGNVPGTQMGETTKTPGKAAEMYKTTAATASKNNLIQYHNAVPKVTYNTGKHASEKTDKNPNSHKYPMEKVSVPSASPAKTVPLSYPPKTGVTYPQAALTVPFGNTKGTNVLFPSDFCAGKGITQTYSRNACNYSNTSGSQNTSNIMKNNVNSQKPKKQKEYTSQKFSEVESRDVNNQLLPPGLQNAIRTKRPYKKKEDGEVETKRSRPGRKPKAAGEKGEKKRSGRPRRAETVRSLLEKKAQQQMQQQPEPKPTHDDVITTKESVKTIPKVPVIPKALVVPKVTTIAEKSKVTVTSVTKSNIQRDIIRKPVLHPKPVFTNAVIEETPSTRVIIQNGIVHSTQPGNPKLHIPSPAKVNITPKPKPAIVKTTPQTVPLAANPPSRTPQPSDITQHYDIQDVTREVTPPKSWSNGDASSVSSPGSISNASSPRSPASPDSGLSVRISGTPSPSQRSPGSSNGSTNGHRGRANKRESIDQIADILARKKAKITTKGSNNSCNDPIVNGDTPTGPKSVSQSSNNNLTNSHSANAPQVTKRTSVSTPQRNNIPNGQADYRTPAKGSTGVANESPLSSSPEDPADNIPLALVAKGYDQPLELTTKKKPNGDIKRDSVPLKIPHLVKI